MDFRERLTSGDVRSSAIGQFDPENMGVAVGISTISVVVSEILVLPVCWRPCWIDSGVIETSIFSGFVYAFGTLGIKVISNLGAIFPRFRDIAGFLLKPATPPSIPP